MSTIVDYRICPVARTHLAVAVPITTGVQSYLAWDTKDWDPWGMWSATVNPSRLTCQIPGYYRVSANIVFVPNATGTRQLGVAVNRATFYAFVQDPVPVVANSRPLQVADTVQLGVGDYVEAWCFQTSGGNLNVQVGSALALERVPTIASA